MKDVPKHEQQEDLRVLVEYPEHEPRTESEEFRANKHKLVHEMNLPCWKCGSKLNLEVHHYIIEWSEWDSADPTKVLEAMKRFNAYGFQGDDLPKSPDDVRNLMVLCKNCHRGAGLGIHLVPVPFWFADMVRKDGEVVLEPPRKK